MVELKVKLTRNDTQHEKNIIVDLKEHSVDAAMIMLNWTCS